MQSSSYFNTQRVPSALIQRDSNLCSFPKNDKLINFPTGTLANKQEDLSCYRKEDCVSFPDSTQ
jgi:hypothetical protein